MDIVLAYLANSRKAIINVLTVALALLTYILGSNLLPDKYAAFATSAVAAIGFVLHYVTSNAPPPGTVAATDDGVFTTPALTDADGEEVPNEEPNESELDEGPVVNEIPVLPSTGKHEAADPTT